MNLYIIIDHMENYNKTLEPGVERYIFVYVPRETKDLKTSAYFNDYP